MIKLAKRPLARRPPPIRATPIRATIGRATIARVTPPLARRALAARVHRRMEEVTAAVRQLLPIRCDSAVSVFWTSIGGIYCLCAARIRLRGGPSNSVCQAVSLDSMASPDNNLTLAVAIEVLRARKR